MIKRLIILSLIFSLAWHSSAQNVGINQSNPTNSIHISPITLGDDPLRVEGIQAYSVGDTSILVINSVTGIVKYINASDLSGILINSNVISNISDSLFLNPNFNDSLTAYIYNYGDTLLYNSNFINSLKDSIDTDVDSLNLNGTLLTVYENGNTSSVNLSTLSDNDGDPTNEIELPNSAVTGQVLTWDGTSWIAQNSASGADNWGSQTVVSGNGFSGNGTALTPLNYTETDGSITNELQTITSSGSNITLSNGGGTISINDADSDPTNEHNTSISLSGNTLSILDGGGTISIDLTPLINTAVANAVPSGTINAYAGSTPPTGYLVCDGSVVSRATYVDLFNAIGTTYGNGNGSTTFNLPNYMGQFLRGVDNGQGIDLGASSRTNRGDGVTGDAVGTKQSNQTLAHNHSVNPPTTSTNTTGSHLHSVNPPNTNTTSSGSHNHGSRTGGISTFNGSTWIVYDDNLSNSTTSATNGTPTTCGSSFNGQGTVGNFMGRLNSSCLSHTHTISTDGNHSHSVDIPQFNSSTTGNHSHTVNIASFNSGNNGGLETRPTNVSVLWCIKF